MITVRDEGNGKARPYRPPWDLGSNLDSLNVSPLGRQQPVTHSVSAKNGQSST